AVPLPDRHLVNADDLRRGPAGASQLFAHILHLELLDRAPRQVQFRGNVLDARGAAAPPYVERESLRVMGIVGQPVETLPLHRATAPARDTAQLDLHEDPHTSAG